MDDAGQYYDIPADHLSPPESIDLVGIPCSKHLKLERGLTDQISFSTHYASVFISCCIIGLNSEVQSLLDVTY